MYSCRSGVECVPRDIPNLNRAWRVAEDDWEVIVIAHNKGCWLWTEPAKSFSHDDTPCAPFSHTLSPFPHTFLRSRRVALDPHRLPASMGVYTVQYGLYYSCPVVCTGHRSLATVTFRRSGTGAAVVASALSLPPLGLCLGLSPALPSRRLIADEDGRSHFFTAMGN